MKFNTEFATRWRRLPSRIAKTPIVLIAGWLAAVPGGCATGGGPVEYIPGDRAVMPLEKGQPAPAEGWFVPPATMREIVPCLDERFQNLDSLEPDSNHE